MKRNINGRHTQKIWIKFLVALSIALFLGVAATYGALKKGIHIKSLSFGDINVTEFHLILKEKLELEIDSIQSVSSGEPFSFESDLVKIRRGIRSVVWATQVFSKLEIHSVELEGIKDTFRLSIGTLQEPWLLNVTSNDLKLEAEIYHGDKHISVKLNSITSEKLQSSGNGEIKVDFEEKLITGTLDANIAGRLPLSLDFTADKKEITFHSNEATETSSIGDIVDLFGLDADIQPWITEYLQGKRFQLAAIKGTIPWENPQYLLESLYGEVRINDAEYRFAQELAPIETRFTDVVYSKGVLTITPHEAAYTMQSTESSWLDINFNDSENILLTIYLKTHASLDDDILTLLRHYDIDLPFKQIEGKTAVDLTLKINLSTEEVAASGSFVVSQSSFLWSDQEILVRDGKIGLIDSDITLERMNLGIEDLAFANLTGALNPVKNSGKIFIELDSFFLDIGRRELIIDKEKPKATLHIQAEEYILEAEPSFWSFGDLKLQLGKFYAPITIDNFWVSLPPTSLMSQSQLIASISGSYSTLLQKADFTAHLSTFDYGGFVLHSDTLILDVAYDNDWHISTNEKSHWSVKNTPLLVEAAELRYSNDNISIHTPGLQYGGLIECGISGEYDRASAQGNFTVNNLQIARENIGDLKASAKGSVQGFTLTLPEIALRIDRGNDKTLTAVIDDFAPLYERSKLLQLLKINKGQLEVISENSAEFYTFKAEIKEPLPILLHDNLPINQLTLLGRNTKNGVTADINDDLHVEYTGEWLISSDKIGFNLPEILKLVNYFIHEPETPNINSEPFKIAVQARNSSLFLRQGNEILADAFIFTYTGNQSTFHLEHGEGSVDASTEGDRLQVVGKNLNSVFMDALAREAEFGRGEMSVVAYGRFNHFSIIFQVNDVLLERFTTLNKILAFVNTVPDLATFSLPDYGAQGLPVTTATAGAVVEDGVATIKSFDLQSPQMTMLGSGWVNLPGNLMEMEFNLTTKAKKKLSKIPLFGYIIVGQKEMPSITVKVRGDVSDPEVESSVFKEITTIPFSLLYRTLTLPYTLVEPVYDSMKKYEAPEKSFPYGEKKDEDGK